MENTHWSVVDGRYTEAALAIRAICSFDASIRKTRHNLVLAVGELETQIGLNEQFTSAQWLQIPLLASLMTHDVRFTDTSLWLGETLVMNRQATDGVNLTPIEFNDGQLLQTLNVLHELATVYNHFFKHLQSGRFNTPNSSETITAIKILIQYIDKATAPVIAERVQFDNAIATLAGIYALQYNSAMVESLHALRHSTITADTLSFRGVVLDKQLLIKDLLAQVATLGF